MNELTPLLLAISIHRDGMVALLVEHGADKLATTSSGRNVKTMVEKGWYWKGSKHRAFLESLGFDLSTESD